MSSRAQRPCRHETYLDSVDVAHRPIRTCSGCGARLGTCSHCRRPNVELEADDITTRYHDHPIPCRSICRGAKQPCVERST